MTAIPLSPVPLADETKALLAELASVSQKTKMPAQIRGLSEPVAGGGLALARAARSSPQTRADGRCRMLLIVDHFRIICLIEITMGMAGVVTSMAGNDSWSRACSISLMRFESSRRL